MPYLGDAVRVQEVDDQHGEQRALRPRHGTRGCQSQASERRLTCATVLALGSSVPHAAYRRLVVRARRQLERPVCARGGAARVDRRAEGHVVGAREYAELGGAGAGRDAL